MSSDSDKIVFGCLGALFLFFLLLPICFAVSATLLYLLMNVLLPVIGIVHPLTWVQCFAASIAFGIIGMFVRSILGTK
jgi:hypothetical protein